MLGLSIRRKIMGVAIALIVLMVITAVLSLVWVEQVEGRLQELTNNYIPAYGHLARANIRSLERALALRRMITEKLQPQSQSSGDKSPAIRSVFDAKGVAVEQEALAARASINSLIEKGTTPTDDVASLVRLDSRIDAAMADSRRQLNAEIERLLGALQSADANVSSDSLARVDLLRDELDQKLESIRADMLALVRADATRTMDKQRQTILIAAAMTGLAALLGLAFAALVSGGI